MKAIETRGLTKYYGKNRGVDGLDLQVEQGAFFGFIGPNGAGKSTTIRLLLGLIRPTGGSGKVLGLDIQQNQVEIMKKVGYLPSEASFYDGLRVREVLRLSADLRRMDCTARAEELCQRLELDQNRKVGELSFGNRKKVGIVCALQADPELLVLDEPTGGLDPLMQKEFFDILRERNRQGTTIFLSSHVLSEVQNNCDHAAIIREGNIIACDRMEQLARANARKVTVRGQVALQGLSGVRNVQEENGTVSFLYSGEMGQLLQVLAAGKVADLSVAEPDLEEMFLHYYGKDGDRA